MKHMNHYGRPGDAHPSACAVRPAETCRCEDCRCDQSRPDRGRRYLLPRVIACGREWMRRCQVNLRVEGLPTCAEPPYVLSAVYAVGEPVWTQETDPARREMCLHVTVPLLCQVEDRCGRMHCGRSCVEMDTTLPLPVSPAECWRNHLIILPCVRLVCAACPAANSCFDAQLEIHLESYMVRWEPCLSAAPEPSCPPPLPLYPQPCRE